MLKTRADQVKWSGSIDAVRMKKGEEPMRFFSRVDNKIVGILASLGVTKSVGDVNRKLVRVLTMKWNNVLFRIAIISVEPKLRT